MCSSSSTESARAGAPASSGVAPAGEGAAGEAPAELGGELTNLPSGPTVPRRPAPTVQAVCLLVLTALALAGAMYLLRDVLVPFVLAVYLALLLGPPIDAMVRKLGLPRGLAVTVMFLAGAVLLAAVVAATTAAVATTVQNRDRYLAALDDSIERLAAYFPLDSLLSEDPPAADPPPGDAVGRAPDPATDAAADPLAIPPRDLPPPTELAPAAGLGIGGRLGPAPTAPFDPRLGPLADPPPGVAATGPDPGASPATRLRQQLVGQINAYLAERAHIIGGTLVNLVGTGLLVGIFLLFLLIGRGHRQVAPDSLWCEIESRIQSYIGLTLLVSAATGLLVGLILTLLGVPFPWVFGAAAFVLNFIPTVGSIIATLLPLPVVLFNEDLSLTARVLAIALPALVQFALGNVVAPKLMGDKLDLSPVAVLLGLIFFGTIWGLLGAFLATPLMVTLKLAFERISVLRPVAHALAGRIGEGGGKKAGGVIKLQT